MPKTASQATAVDMPREQLRTVIVGHVDHGKSSLVGRLFHDTGSLPEGKFEAIKAMCERRGMPFEWAFLMDSFQSERDQGITIDTAQIWFKTAKRDYVIIDAPGHREFIKNMITGAASADAALLLIDAGHGVQQQSRLHGYLLHLLGIRQIAVLVNKMDLVDWSQARFEEIQGTFSAYLAGIGVTADHFIPISAREGATIAQRRPELSWYEGPSVLEALDGFRPSLRASDLPLRLPLQDIYKFDERRILVGRIESGRLRVGDRLLFSPSNKTATVASIEGWSQSPILEAQAGRTAPAHAHDGHRALGPRGVRQDVDAVHLYEERRVVDEGHTQLAVAGLRGRRRPGRCGREIAPGSAIRAKPPLRPVPETDRQRLGLQEAVAVEASAG